MSAVQPEPEDPALRSQFFAGLDNEVTQWAWALRSNRLAVLALVVGEADRLLAEQVQYDRDCGRSWTSIALDLGVTRQAAAQRFGAAS